MKTVNMLQAKSTLSKLVEAIESGREEEVIIARNGRPAAQLVPVGNVGLVWLKVASLPRQTLMLQIYKLPRCLRVRLSQWSCCWIHTSHFGRSAMIQGFHHKHAN